MLTVCLLHLKAAAPQEQRIFCYSVVSAVPRTISNMPQIFIGCMRTKLNVHPYSAIANTSKFYIRGQEKPKEFILLLFHFRRGNDDSIWSLGREIGNNVFVKINCPP